MKITLINPPSPFLIDQKSFPPLGLLYLATVLDKNGHEVDVIDLANNENNIEKCLENCDADIYGITSTTPQYLYAKKIKDILKNYNSFKYSKNNNSKNNNSKNNNSKNNYRWCAPIICS